MELQQLLDEEKLANVPLLVMANKQDLLNALSPDEVRIPALCSVCCVYRRCVQVEYELCISPADGCAGVVL